ncbi:MAG: MOSC domain-containing protein [Ignavibacteriales bacterium]|nr:MOSC domain-containing protein [Ignavibacteriales bacterium]
MTIISTNIGRPRKVVWRGRTITTGIYKEPVASIVIRKYYVEGDSVSDLEVHGGERKAVYGYPSEHYEFWRKEYPAMGIGWGMFGENITTEGLFENEVKIGSRYRIGTAQLQVTEPRMPCYKLGIRFGTPDIVARFLKSRKSGFYFAVIEEGMISPGDRIVLEHASDEDETILDVVNRAVRKEGKDV